MQCLSWGCRSIEEADRCQYKKYTIFQRCLDRDRHVQPGLVIANCFPTKLGKRTILDTPALQGSNPPPYRMIVSHHGPTVFHCCRLPSVRLHADLPYPFRKLVNYYGHGGEASVDNLEPTAMSCLSRRLERFVRKVHGRYFPPPLMNPI